MSAAGLTIITSGNAQKPFQNTACETWDTLSHGEASENHVCHFCQKLLVFPKSWRMGLEMGQRPGGSCWRATNQGSKTSPCRKDGRGVAAADQPAGNPGTTSSPGLAWLHPQEGLGPGPGPAWEGGEPPVWRGIPLWRTVTGWGRGEMQEGWVP